MGDFPDFFYSRAPIPTEVSLCNFKDGKPYFMLSLTNTMKVKKSAPSLAPYDDNDADLLDCGELEDGYEINPTKSGKYLTQFYVPPAFHADIVGSRGAKLRELQDATNTLIKIPRINEGGIVKVTGPSERNVASARTQIMLFVQSKREKKPLTHFVSIPIRSVSENFEKFKREILTGVPTRGIDESIFQNVNKLHLTVVPLVLMDDKEIGESVDALSRCERIFKGRKIGIVVKGVEIMNDDPSEVDVLYGKIEANPALQEVADGILEEFYKTGLVRRQYEGVKLHVTLMNSLFRKTENDKKRQSFDATDILKKYQNFYFGSFDLKQIHLSIRFTSSPDGYYNSAAVFLT